MTLRFGVFQTDAVGGLDFTSLSGKLNSWQYRRTLGSANVRMLKRTEHRTRFMALEILATLLAL